MHSSFFIILIHRRDDQKPSLYTVDTFSALAAWSFPQNRH